MQSDTRLDAALNDGDLRSLAGIGSLNPLSLGRARELIGITPDAARWHTFLTRLAVVGGAAIASSALICFIAYNWNALGRGFRFGLIQGLMVIAVAIALLAGKRATIANAAGLVAFFALGGLLALTGQTYQTGADPWQLFAGWAALGLMWVLASRWWGLWMVWLLVAETGLSIWAFGDARWGRWLTRHDEPAMFLCVTNAAIFASFFWARRFESMNVPWLWRVAAAFTVYWAVVTGCVGAWDAQLDASTALHVLAGGGVLGAMWWWTSRAATSHFEPWLMYLVGFGAVILSANWLLRIISSASWELASLLAVYVIGAAVFIHSTIRKKTEQHAAANASTTEANQ